MPGRGSSKKSGHSKGRYEKKAWVRKRGPYLFIKAAGTVRLPTCLVKLPCSPSAMIDGAVGLPAPVLMRILR